MGRWLICAAWPYAYSVPHLGNIIGSVLSADVIARFLRLKGEDVVFVSGSDEYGVRMEFEALKQGVTPKELVDRNHKLISECFKKFGISFDRYSRTTSSKHAEFVRGFYKRLYELGYIFTREEEYPYCEKCRRFLPDRFIEGICPYCGYEEARGDQCENCGRILDPSSLLQPRCAMCGSKPVKRKSLHWYLNLPLLEEKVKEYVKNSVHWPPNVKNYTEMLLKEGLKPRPITRDISWGIPAPFPGSEGKTIYCWAEAVLGYISATIEWAEKNGRNWRDYWINKETKSIYFIGKDNIPFHSILLPALLIASNEGYVLPWQISATEFLCFEGKKFSKSRRIGIWVDEALELLEPDYWRFYLLLIRPEKRDTNFMWDEFTDVINNKLIASYGNFVYRVLSFTDRYFKGVIPKPGEFKEVDKNAVEKWRKTVKEIEGHLVKIEIKKAVEKLLKLTDVGNEYFQAKEPWKAVKEKVEGANTTIYICVNMCASLAIASEPFIPFTSERIWKALNMDGSVHKQKWEKAYEFLVKPGHKIGKPVILFRKLDKKALLERLNEIRRLGEAGEWKRSTSAG